MEAFEKFLNTSLFVDEYNVMRCDNKFIFAVRPANIVMAKSRLMEKISDFEYNINVIDNYLIVIIPA